MIRKATEIVLVLIMLTGYQSVAVGDVIYANELSKRLDVARTHALAPPIYSWTPGNPQRSYSVVASRDVVLSSAAAHFSAEGLSPLARSQTVRSQTDASVDSRGVSADSNMKATLIAGLGIALISVMRRIGNGYHD